MITVIYDGHCDFCKSCVAWAKARAPIKALPNQEINFADYGLSKEQVEKSVVVISDKTYFGAAAVAQVLITTQNYRLARLITLLGPIGEIGYRYVASHRNGFLVKSAHWLINRDLNRN